jgi:cyclophilin family peptidyl-prolyl cis-trans isomerase
VNDEMIHMKHFRDLVALLLVALALASVPAIAAERVEIETSKGVITVDLFPQQAPATVANFLRHVDARFYDGLVFHRVVPDFVVQAGGYDASLQYREPLGTVENESVKGLRNERGTLAMARQNDPDSATSQFYINLRDNDFLDAQGAKPGYTVFGRVTGGMSVVDEIGLVETGMREGMADVPKEPIVIVTVRRLPPVSP